MAQLSSMSFVITAAWLMTLSGDHRTTAAAPSAVQPASAAARSELITVTSSDGTRIGVECAIGADAALRPWWRRRSHRRQMRAVSAYRFDADRMKSVRMPTLLLIGEETASPYAKQSIGALREALPRPTLVVLERQQHNAMNGGREVLANAIHRFAAAKE
jgi:pimeloyl-ACP methyl ester carboxylesterase